MHNQMLRLFVALQLVAWAAMGCSGPREAVPAATESSEAPSPQDAFPEAVRAVLDKPFKGDFDELVKRRAIRVAVTFNRTHYFIDRGQERGITYESLKLFEKDLNASLKTGNLKVHVVIVPMSRDELYPSLTSGKVDMVAAMVTVTPEREKLVAFSEPTRTNVSQVVVTGPGAPPDQFCGRPRRPGSVRPQGEHLRREPRASERSTQGARQASRRHRGRSRCLRRR